MRVRSRRPGSKRGLGSHCTLAHLHTPAGDSPVKVHGGWQGSPIAQGMCGSSCATSCSNVSFSLPLRIGSEGTSERQIGRVPRASVYFEASTLPLRHQMHHGRSHLGMNQRGAYATELRNMTVVGLRPVDGKLKRSELSAFRVTFRSLRAKAVLFETL